MSSSSGIAVAPPDVQAAAVFPRPARVPPCDFQARSLTAVRPHLPAAAVESIAGLLGRMPVLVRVVRRRRTKHGDHVRPPGRHYSVITVNHSGNPYLFLITLLHEIAHARIAGERSGHARPHGREWKAVFSAYLHVHARYFPPDLQPIVLRHARRPLYSTDADPELSQALRRHDTLDRRPMLSELREGQRFWLGGSHAMVKGPLLRKYYRCTNERGAVFRVAAAARVRAALQDVK